jgi:hypothetical protein
MFQICCRGAATTAFPDPVRPRSPALAALFAGTTGGVFGSGSAPWMCCASLAGVIGSTMSSIPNASATALAMHTGVDMQLPSPTPLAPRGVNGDGLS